MPIDDAHTYLPDIWENHARFFPHREAIVCGQDRLSWRAFNERLNRVANGLRALGIGRGDKVAVIMTNSCDMLVVLYGIIKAGACVVPISTLLSPPQILGLVNDAGAAILIICDATKHLLDPVVKEMSSLRRDGRYMLERKSAEPEEVPSGNKGRGGDGWISLNSWLATQPVSEPDVEYRLDDPVNIIYSSGTTGVPKGIVQTHRARQHFAWSNVIEMGFTRHSRALVTTALYSNGTWLMALPTLFAGGTLHILENFSPKAFLSAVEREAITHTFMVPTQYIVTLEEPDFSQYDLSSLRVMLSAGSPLRTDTKAEIVARMGAGLYELYGFSEGAATLIKPEDGVRKPGSVGTPVVGFDIRIIGDDDHELGFGETGEIVSWGQGIMLEYHNRTEATEKLIWRGPRGRTFLRSGDIGRFDDEGFLYILDRKKDMIISGGFNVFPADIERVLGQHPDVSDATVIGIPHDKWGETPLGLIIAKPGAAPDTEAIRLWANERLAKPQRLAALELRDDFPRNALGKVIKRELRDDYLPGGKG